MSILHDGYGQDDVRILDGERRFLGVLLTSPDGTATLTEATPPEYLDKPFEDGGRWRGSIPRRLAGRGLIAPVLSPAGNNESTKSVRKARNRGTVALWRLLDPAAGRRRKHDLDAHFARFPTGVRRDPGLFDGLDLDGPGLTPG